MPERTVVIDELFLQQNAGKLMRINPDTLAIEVIEQKQDQKTLPLPLASSWLDDGEEIKIVEAEPWESVDRNLWAIRENESRLKFSGKLHLEQVELKTCHLIVKDEIVTVGRCRIFIDAVTAYGFTFQDADVVRALETAKRRIEDLRRFTVIQTWNSASIGGLRGRKIYYREQPAVIVSYHADWGMLHIAAGDDITGAMLTRFKTEPWRFPTAFVPGMKLPCETDIKTDLFDPQIHWTRE